MNLCLACEAAEPVGALSPFCSVECLHADPRQSKSPVLLGMLAAFDDRSTGAGGAGGMVPTRAAEQMRWYLAGALDARADVLDELVTAARQITETPELATPDER